MEREKKMTSGKSNKIKNYELHPMCRYEKLELTLTIVKEEKTDRRINICIANAFSLTFLSIVPYLCCFRSAHHIIALMFYFIFPQTKKLGHRIAQSPGGSTMHRLQIHRKHFMATLNLMAIVSFFLCCV